MHRERRGKTRSNGNANISQMTGGASGIGLRTDDTQHLDVDNIRGRPSNLRKMMDQTGEIIGVEDVQLNMSSRRENGRRDRNEVTRGRDNRAVQMKREEKAAAEVRDSEDSDDVDDGGDDEFDEEEEEESEEEMEVDEQVKSGRGHRPKNSITYEA